MMQRGGGWSREKWEQKHDQTLLMLSKRNLHVCSSIITLILLDDSVEIDNTLLASHSVLIDARNNDKNKQ